MCIITTTVASTAAIAATAILSTAATAASAAVSLSQISAQKKATAYQIEQSKNQAKNAELQAAYERQEGIEEARQKKLNSILNMHNQKAKLAANNIALSSQSVLNMEEDLKLNSELDALTISQNAEKKAQYYLNKRNNLYQNAALISFNNKLNTNKAYVQLGTSAFNSSSLSSKNFN